MKRSLLFVPAAVVAVVAAMSVAAPDAQSGGLRLTKFEPGDLHPVICGAGPVHSTSYVLGYSVTNETKDGRKPGLRLEVKTKDTGKTHGDAFDSAVFAAVKGETKASEEPKSTAKLRSEDLAAGAKASGLANFGSIDPNSDEFQVRVYGLYDPVFRDRFGKVWSENRVLVMTYTRKGDEYDRHLDPLTLTSTADEVEGDVKEVHPK